MVYMKSQAEEIIPVEKKTSDYKQAGLFFTFAGSAFIMLIFLLEALYPGYSVHSNAISDLLATTANTSIIGEPIAFAISIAWIAGGYFAFRGGGKRGMLVLNLLPGTGLLLTVLSPENVNVAIHSVGALLAFIPGTIVMFLSFSSIRTQLRYYSLVSALISLLGIIFEFGGYSSPL